jgi:hypothetical protein
MSSKKATELSVFTAADQLWAAGEEPTYEKVIALTGRHAAAEAEPSSRGQIHQAVTEDS